MKICRINTLSSFQDKGLQNSSKNSTKPSQCEPYNFPQSSQGGNVIRNNALANISFRGISEDIIGKSTDVRLQLPYKMIKITDPNPENKGCTYEFCTDEPYREFLKENLQQVLSSSSHYHKNSKIEKVRELEAIPLEQETAKFKVVGGSKKSAKKVSDRVQENPEPVYKEPFECKKFDYRGKVYFEDMDESCTPEIYAANNIIVHDRKPNIPGFSQIKYSYYFDIKAPKRAVSGSANANKYKEALESVEDYSSRKAQKYREKIDTHGIDANEAVFTTERIKKLQKSAKFARTVLNKLNKIDEVIAKRESLETQLKELQKSRDTEDKEALRETLNVEIEKTNEVVSRHFSHLGTYYKNNLVSL